MYNMGYMYVCPSHKILSVNWKSPLAAPCNVWCVSSTKYLCSARVLATWHAILHENATASTRTPPVPTSGAWSCPRACLKRAFASVAASTGAKHGYGKLGDDRSKGGRRWQTRAHTPEPHSALRLCHSFHRVESGSFLYSTDHLHERGMKGGANWGVRCTRSITYTTKQFSLSLIQFPPQTGYETWRIQMKKSPFSPYASKEDTTTWIMWI